MSIFESYRDPQGKVILTRREVWRLVYAEQKSQLEEFLGLRLTKIWQQQRKIVETTVAAEAEAEAFAQGPGKVITTNSEFDLFKHERINFPSFPYEWSPGMLAEAGKLTLEAAENFLTQTGWSLKDATPFNILFDGPNPILVDILSFEKRNPGDPIWLPYNQFVQTFLLPLLVNKEAGVSLQSIFLMNRDGLQSSEASRFFGRIKRLKPEIMSLVTLPNLLSRKAESDSQLYEQKTLDSPEKAQFILEQNFRRLRKQLEKVSPDPESYSDWTEYTKFNQETVPEYMLAKQEFVVETINEFAPRNVLDIGCNTGFFSFLAARKGAAVVAVDDDPAVIDQVFQTTKKENLSVLPLVINLSRPSPRLGWRYSENPSFLDRALNHFDLVMMLAVVHHLLVQERIPLREILRLAADLTKNALIIEFVPPGDDLFKRLARGRDSLHRELSTDTFRKAAEEFFHVRRAQQLPQTERWIYLMQKK